MHSVAAGMSPALHPSWGRHGCLYRKQRQRISRRLANRRDGLRLPSTSSQDDTDVVPPSRASACGRGD